MLGAFGVFESFHKVCLFFGDDLLIARYLIFFEFLGDDVLVVLNPPLNILLYLIMLNFKRFSNLLVFLLDPQRLSRQIMIFECNAFLTRNSRTVSLLNRVLFLLHFISKILYFHDQVHLTEL